MKKKPTHNKTTLTGEFICDRWIVSREYLNATVFINLVGTVFNITFFLELLLISRARNKKIF